MKVTYVPQIPPEGALAAGNVGLTPELLAATGARYSRNNEGLEQIIKNVYLGNEAEINRRVRELVEEWRSMEDIMARADRASNVLFQASNIFKELREPQLDKGVDRIFKMVDYGHASIADMANVAIFMDDISIYLAYMLWRWCPTASGQEASTRYIKMSPEGLVDPDLLGIPKNRQDSWRKYMGEAFKLYEEKLAFWTEYAEKHPELLRIPKALLEDESESAKKQVARMKRNYAFDRARYYIPVACKTNVMMVMSARSWVQLCVMLLSHPVPEFKMLGEMIKEQLGLATPRLVKHAKPATATERFHRLELEFAGQYGGERCLWKEDDQKYCKPDEAYLIVHDTSHNNPNYDLELDLEARENRYSTVGPALSNHFVTFGWNAVALAEIRDFNRHRTGKKWCVLAPVGFYDAWDQYAAEDAPTKIEPVVCGLTNMAYDLLLQDMNPCYMYCTLLGHQYPFEHTTSADHAIYEIELRTGVGSHFRYAEHLKNVLQLFYEELPETINFVFEGTAEPE